MEKYSRAASVIIVLCIIVSCIVGGFVSSIYFDHGPDIEDVEEDTSLMGEVVPLVPDSS